VVLVYAGRAVFGKTRIIYAQPGLNRAARLQGRTTPWACGYGYYRTSARTARRKIDHYRCILDKSATVNALRKRSGRRFNQDWSRIRKIRDRREPFGR
jgi:hypothetical protein